MFENCYKEIGLELSEVEAYTIRICLQVLSSNLSWFCEIIGSLSIGESGADDAACIIPDTDKEEGDQEEGIPDFVGVCFNYEDYYTVVTREQAEVILQRCIDEVSLITDFPVETARYKKEGIFISPKMNNDH